MVNRRSLSVGALSLGIVALLAAGCGDDDDGGGAFSQGTDQSTSTSAGDEATAGGTGGEYEAYCAASAAVETAPTAGDQDVQTWAAETIKPLVDAALAAAPPELAADAELQAGVLDEIIATGDTSATGDPDYIAAVENMHAFDMANCGWNVVDVLATEYSFSGIPGQLSAGVTSFEFTNQGQELHEIRLFRIADGVTDSAEDIAAAVDLETLDAGSLAELAGTGEYTDVGDDGYFLADLEPGKYFAACFIPMGAMSEDASEAPPLDAPLHFTQGMLVEFTVS